MEENNNSYDIKWAVLGTGVIANEMAQVLQKSGKKIFAVGNRTYSKAVAFAEKYGVEKVYSDFNEMFTDPDVDAIYITTPHNTHIGFMRKAIEGGKHILVEKSITLNSAELEEAVALAEKHHVLIGEAMTIYHMPVYRELKKIIDSGELGKINMITFAPTGVDEQVTMLLSNEEGQMATVALSLHSKQPKRAMISCEKAYIEIMEYPRAWEARITDAVNGEVRTVCLGDHADALKYELEDFEAAIRNEVNQLHLDYTIDVMELMTKSRYEWGMTYPEEKH